MACFTATNRTGFATGINGVVMKNEPYVLIITMLMFVSIVGCTDKKPAGDVFLEKNYLQNGSIEAGGNVPENWEPIRYGRGQELPTFQWSDAGRNGSKCLHIAAKENVSAGWRHRTGVP